LKDNLEFDFQFDIFDQFKTIENISEQIRLLDLVTKYAISIKSETNKSLPEFIQEIFYQRTCGLTKLRVS
jgi:hypothetical protein